MRSTRIVLCLCAILPAAPGEIHQFKPARYSLVFSATPEPVLRLKPGDSVATTSVDSEGGDETGAIVGPKYNALTGPFFIEGAQPGDTLVVHLDRVRLNSKGGLASSRMGDNAVTARDFAAGQPGAKLYRWTYDFDSMTASTTLTPRLSRLRMPLRPFPGCVGVAPANGESLSSLYAGPHGGNLDYRHLVEGTTLYFPVSVAGAYFYFGDGHAFQGDGEPNGGSVETPLAVTFRVELQKGPRLPALRAESPDDYIALGAGNPIDTAYQRATANMIHWLTTTFALDRQEAHVLIGTSARYDFGSVVNDRGNSVACRISKSLLHQMLGR